jgi:hypothetical protein
LTLSFYIPLSEDRRNIQQALNDVASGKAEFFRRFYVKKSKFQVNSVFYQKNALKNPGSLSILLAYKIGSFYNRKTNKKGKEKCSKVFRQ